MDGVKSGSSRWRVQITAVPAWPEHGDVAQRPLDVSVGNVAEDAAGQDDIGGTVGGVDVGERRIGLDDMEVGKPGAGRPFAGDGGVHGIDFDEHRGHVVPSRVGGQDPEQVRAPAGAHADDPDGVRRCGGEPLGEAPLNDPQPLGKRAQRVVVLLGAGLVVADQRAPVWKGERE